MNKKIIWIVMMLIMLTALPLQAFAMTEVSVEIPFAVENIKGTVIIEAVDDAPLPEVTAFRDVAEGVFEISYTQPDTHYYRVYQLIPENTDNVIYDATVYNVVVSVLSDDDGVLHTVCTVSIDGSAEKRESIVFENKIPDEDKDETTTQNTTSQNTPPQTGDNSNLGLWIVISLLSLTGILIMLFIGRRKKNS